jgi:hypothetical protein
MSNLSDVIGGADLFNGSSYSFALDRFCNPNQAIYFKNGYLHYLVISIAAINK